MKFPFSARLGAYLALFGVLCQLLYINWLRGIDYPCIEPSIPLPIAMLIAYGAVLFLRPSISQAWERDELFERATRRGFIARAAGPWNVSKEEAGARIQKSESRSNVPNFEFRFSNFVGVSPLRRQVPPERYCLKLSTLGFLYALPLTLMVATFVLGEGYSRSALAARIWGLRVYVAGPSGMAQPWIERTQKKLVVKVTSVPEWILDSKPITEAEADRIREKLYWWRDYNLRETDHLIWKLNSKPVTQEELQQALREELSRRRVRFVYLDVDRTKNFRVAAEVIEAVQQTPDTRVVLVTDEVSSDK